MGDGLGGMGEQRRQVVRLIHVMGERVQAKDAGGQATGDRLSLVEDGGTTAVSEGDHVGRPQGESARAAIVGGGDGDAPLGEGVEDGLDVRRQGGGDVGGDDEESVCALLGEGGRGVGESLVDASTEGRLRQGRSAQLLGAGEGVRVTLLPANVRS